MGIPNLILSKEAASKKLQRMALEVVERNTGKNELVLIGIKENGIHIAKIIAGYLADSFPGKVKVIELNINKKMPGAVQLNETVDFNDKNIILIDDVANSGRTMLYALQPLLQFIPSRIQTLALVERTHKQFPVAVDYVGCSVSTSLKENIVVEIENAQVSGAWIK